MIAVMSFIYPSLCVEQSWRFSALIWSHAGSLAASCPSRAASDAPRRVVDRLEKRARTRPGAHMQLVCHARVRGLLIGSKGMVCVG